MERKLKMTDLEIVQKDRDSLYIGNIRTVEFDLNLPAEGENGSEITWETGNDRIISIQGKVTRPKYGMGSRTVLLTATVRYGKEKVERVFEVRVLEEENKIQIEKVFPVYLESEKGKVFYLPTAVVVQTKEGRVIPHLVEWENFGERIYEKTGIAQEHGKIAGTQVDVTVSVEVKDCVELYKMSSTPNVQETDKNTVLSGESFFEKAQGWSEEFLLSVNDDQMLYNFRAACGLDTKGAPEMIGWDAPDSNLRGHTTGHYMSGLALCYRAGKNEEIRKKAVYMCDALKECQEAFSRMENIQDGFLSGYDETQFDLLEKYVRYPEIWAPYYTLHKIFSGLLDCWEYAKIPKALEIADKLGDWVYNRLSRLPHHVLMNMWSLYIAGEFGGMNDVMARLYGITGKEIHLKASRMFDNDKLFFPLSQKIDALDTLHANQHIPQIIGCMTLFEVTGEKRYYDIARFFWESVTKDHIYVIGGTGEGEMFHGSKEIGEMLSKNTAESCASYNMLKLTKELFKYEPVSSYMDYYERTMFNHIASSCEHAPTGASTYFMPLAPGFHKEFDDENSCCHGTGLENHFKYTEAIYFTDRNSIYVNLFVPSVLKMEDIEIRQEISQFSPKQVKILVKRTGNRDLKIRIPYWCKEKYNIKLNGENIEVEKLSDGYCTISGVKNSEIQIDFSCTLRLERTPDKPEVAALCYGPYVLAALTDQEEFLNLPLTEENLENMVKTEEQLRFVCGKTVFVPLYSICHEKYQVYFKI